MTARQEHGKLYENILFNRNPDWVDMRDKHTAKDDFYLADGTPVSAKCQGWGPAKRGNTIYFGDVLRMCTKEISFWIYAGWYKGPAPQTIEELEKTLYEEHIVKVDIVKWKTLLPDIKIVEEAVKELKENIVAGTYCPIEEKKWQDYSVKYKSLWNESTGNGIFKLNPKREHKTTQKRLQCSISYKNFKDFFNLD